MNSATGSLTDKINSSLNFSGNQNNFSSISSRRWKLLHCFLVLLVLVPGLSAQQDQGTITGVVKDPQGLAIPAASVSLTNQETGLVLNTKANQSGVYVFSPIKIGKYSVAAMAPGFSVAERKGLELNIAQRLGVDLQLVVGNANEKVEVSTESPILQTEDASLSQTFRAREIEKSPLYDRDYTFLAQLAAGVNEVVGARGTNDFSSNGMRQEQNTYILDGVDNNVNIVDYINNTSYAVAPPPEALSEFKLQTGDYSAEFGHSAGAVVNATIKSGTNHLHGKVWEYLRNDDFDARSYFSGGVPKPELRQNEFGGTLGGAVLRDKLFFFGDYQGERIISSTAVGIYTVPTALMRKGDFSELLNSSLTNGAVKTLYVPGTAGTVVQQCNGKANAFCSVNSVAQNILNLFPQPNYGTPGQTYSNYAVNPKGSNNLDQFDVRLDWNISAKDQLFTRFDFINKNSISPPPFPLPLVGGSYTNGLHPTEGRNFVVSSTHIFNPTFINEFRFGYNYLNSAYYELGFDQPNLASQLGLGGTPSPANDNGGIPSFSVSGISAFGSPGYTPIAETENVYQFLDNITKIVGNHSLKFGLNLQRVRTHVVEPTNSHGSYSYSGKYTQDPSNTGKTGFGVADFIEDYQATAGLSTISTMHEQRWYRSAYAMDDWKVTPKLTLNLGLRYEYFEPYSDKNGSLANFVIDPSRTSGTYYIPRSASNVPIGPSYAAALAKDNVKIAYTDNPSLVTSQKLNFAPRFGFAYSPASRWVIRGAYGMFYSGIENLGFSSNMGNNLPFTYNVSLASAGCTKVPLSCPTDGLTLANGFTNVLAVGIDQYSAIPSLNGTLPHPKTTYVQEFNATIEYQLSHSMALTVGYVGSTTHHIQVVVYPNRPNQLLLAGANLQANRPFPDLAAGDLVLDGANNNYNSLQTKLVRHLASGLSFTSTYTFAHALGDDYDTFGGNAETGTGYRNPYQLGLSYDYGTSLLDVRHRATLNLQYELPFGKNRHFLSGANGFVQALAGGWDISGTFRVQTGQPVEIGASNGPTNGVGGALAYRVGNPFSTNLPSTNGVNGSNTNCAKQVRTVKAWFNPCAFINPTPASGPNYATQISAYGPYGRTEVSTPGYNQLDTSFFKEFLLFHDHSLQFRADSFNILNHPALGSPADTIGAALGTITSTRNGPRTNQLAVKYTF